MKKFELGPSTLILILNIEEGTSGFPDNYDSRQLLCECLKLAIWGLITGPCTSIGDFNHCIFHFTVSDTDKAAKVIIGVLGKDLSQFARIYRRVIAEPRVMVESEYDYHSVWPENGDTIEAHQIANILRDVLAKQRLHFIGLTDPPSELN